MKYFGPRLNETIKHIVIVIKIRISLAFHTTKESNSCIRPKYCKTRHVISPFLLWI